MFRSSIASRAAFALLATSLLATTAHSGAFSVAGAAQPKIIVPTADDVNDPFFKVGADVYSGVGGLVLNTRSLDRDGFVSVCTGTLINPRVVLTAAHCVDSVDLYRARFRTGATNRPINPLPGDPLGFNRSYEAVAKWIHPNYDPGNFAAGWDIAVLILDTPRDNGEAIYGLYDQPGDERFAIHEKVGFGTTGNGATGTSGSDLAKRVGINTYDFLGDEIFSDVNDQVWLYDTDSGLAENDIGGFLVDNFGFNPIFRDSGIYYSAELDIFSYGPPDPDAADDWRLVESGASGGDSGGSTFIDGLIAGVTSFGITGAIFDGDCGPGFLDPSFSASGSCTNSSWGEFGGDTRVSAFLEELAFYQSFRSIRETERLSGFDIQALPTPASLVLFGLGVASLAFTRRR